MLTTELPGRSQIILQKKYGLRPTYFECPPDLGQIFREAQAALLIGDDALRTLQTPSGYHVYDLGEEWSTCTGGKMVYAVWSIRRDCSGNYPEIVHKVLRASKHCMEMSNSLGHFFKTLKFEFGSEYQQGFLTYLKKARPLGAVDAVGAFIFLEIQP